MAINFPASPSTNDIHVDGANRWQWNGTSWTRIGGVSSDADVINSTNDNSTTTLYPVMVTGTGSQNAKIATSATKNLKFDASEGDLTVGGNISVGGTATFTGSVSVGGTITYEDVRNVDSIGIVTARAGVIVTGNVDTDTLNVSGISTLTGGINVGTAGTISSAGNITLDKPGAGIITATRFVGSGVSLTDVISGVGIRTAGGTVGWAATIIDFRGPGVTTAYYSSVTGVGTVHFTGGGGSASVSISESAPSSPSAGDMWWDSDVGNLQIYYTDANSSQWVTANNSGPTGAQGVQGAVGAQGAQGHQGVQGAVGAQGAQGHQGVQGAQGHQGRQGSVGIASLTISQTPPSSPAQGDMWWDSDDSTLGLYYNDGNSSQWVNINHGPSGAQGAAGAQGAQGHQGVQGTAGTNATISNNADNRVITGGSGTNLNGEASLTFDGTTLTAAGSGGINISSSGADLTMNSAGSIFTGDGGNATDPAVANVSDTNTGFFYPAADTLAVTTGAAERLRISSNGDVTTTGAAFSRTNAGVTARAGDSLNVTRANGTPLEIVRTGGDGTLINFFRDSSQVASINYEGSELTMGTTSGRWLQVGANSVDVTKKLKCDFTVSGSDYCAYFRNSNANSYGVAIQEPSSVNTGYPLLSVTNSSGQSHFRVDTAGLVYANSGCGIDKKAYFVRAWVNFNGTNSAIRGNGNVSSITDNGVGDFTVNFTTSMPNANYSVTGWADNWETTNADSYGLVAGHSNQCIQTGTVRIVTRRMRFDTSSPVAKDFPNTCVNIIC